MIWWYKRLCGKMCKKVKWWFHELRCFLWKANQRGERCPAEIADRRMVWPKKDQSRGVAILRFGCFSHAPCTLFKCMEFHNYLNRDEVEGSNILSSLDDWAASLQRRRFLWAPRFWDESAVGDSSNVLGVSGRGSCAPNVKYQGAPHTWSCSSYFLVEEASRCWEILFGRSLTIWVEGRDGNFACLNQYAWSCCWIPAAALAVGGFRHSHGLPFFYRIARGWILVQNFFV